MRRNARDGGRSSRNPRKPRVVYQADLPVCCFDALSYLLLFDKPEKLASIIENFLWHGIYKLRGGKRG